MNLVQYVLPKKELRKLKSEYQNLDHLQIRMIYMRSFYKDNVEQIQIIPILKLQVRERSWSHIKRWGGDRDGKKTENQYNPSAQSLGAVKDLIRDLTSRNRKSQKPRDLWPSREHSLALISCSLSYAHWLFVPPSFCPFYLLCFNPAYFICFPSPSLPSLLCISFHFLCKQKPPPK